MKNPVDEPSLKTIQVERTLDEAYYPSLDKKTIKIRSKNQVVLKAYTNSLKEEDAAKKPRPILLVPQLWVWRFEDHLISAYSAPGENLQAVHGTFFRGSSGRPKTLKEELQDFSRTTFNDSSHPDLHIGLLLADHIDNFGRTQADDKFQSPLDLYEIGVVHVMSCMNEYVISSKSGTPKIKEEWELMKNITNIRSELAMIDSILHQQKQILNSLIGYTNPDAKKDPDWWKVTSADQRLEGFLKRVTKIDRDAQRTEHDIQDRLNLVRAHASRRDARSSLALSTAVFGFTIVTIIFAPLNFTNGLLGLKSESFFNHTIQVNGTQAFKALYITKWFSKLRAIKNNNLSPGADTHPSCGRVCLFIRLHCHGISVFVVSRFLPRDGGWPWKGKKHEFWKMGGGGGGERRRRRRRRRRRKRHRSELE